MINAVDQIVEEQSGPLAESEVAQLLSVLRNAEFKRSDTRNTKKDTSFKPRSLFEIASAAQAREVGKRPTDVTADQVANATDLKDGILEDIEQGDTKNEGIGDPGEGNLENSLSAGFEAKDDLSSLEIAEVFDGEGKGDLKLEPLALQDGAPNALTSTTEVNQKQETGIAEDLEGGKVAAGFETASEAFERGKAEGIAEGRQEAIAENKAAAEVAAKAELAEKVNAFGQTLASLLKPQAMQAEALTKSIHTAILKLASERAGKEIDDVPDAFANRIAALVSAIGKKINEGQVQLNVDDYSVMTAHFADTKYNFVVNSDLMRGDVVLRFDGIELADIGEKRIGSNYVSEGTSESVPEQMVLDDTNGNSDFMAEPDPDIAPVSGDQQDS